MLTRRHYLLFFATLLLINACKNTQTVTVAHSGSGLTDAAATALFVASLTERPQTTYNLNIQQSMLIDNDSAIYVTPGLDKGLHFNPEIATTIKSTAAL